MMKKTQFIVGFLLMICTQLSMATEYNSNSGYFDGYINSSDDVTTLVNVSDANLVKITITLYISTPFPIETQEEQARLKCSLLGPNYSDLIWVDISGYMGTQPFADMIFELYVPNNTELTFSMNDTYTFAGYYDVVYDVVDDSYYTVHPDNSNWRFGSDGDSYFLGNLESYEIGPLFTVHKDGNVGIGIDEPSTKLHVTGGVKVDNGTITIMDNGLVAPGSNPPLKVATAYDDRYLALSKNMISAFDGSSYSDLLLNHQSPANTLIQCQSSGRVGIGTINPETKLHVWGGTYLGGNTSIGKRAYRHVDFMANIITAYNGSEYEHLLINVPGDQSSEGFVGIGTALPEAKFHVKGDSKFEGDITSTGLVSANNLVVDGNLGISTLVPSENLEIVGNLHLSNGENTKISSSNHNLIFTGVDGGYAHRDYIFRPSWGSQGETHSKIKLQTADLSGNFTDKVQIHSSGQSYFCGGGVGIGSTQAGSTLLVNNTGSHNTTCRIAGNHPEISSGTSINYYKQLDIAPAVYDIPSGSVDNGYRVALGVHGYVHYGNFSGTLNEQVGAWIRAGSYSTAPQGTINQSIALKIDNLTSENVTIIDSYGIYQEASTAKNYFAGNVGIGTTNTYGYQLAVDGTIGATEIIVESLGGADFVFEDDYKLRDLKDVEAFIKDNNHLPEVPSAQDMQEDGISIAAMNQILLQKIEELTLYVIDQQKEIDNLKKCVNKQ